MRCAIARLIFRRPVLPASVVSWSRWRRRHQFVVMRCHYQKQGHDTPEE
ncbi:MAG: hypothetical protein AAF532_00845 [Planctomycetota bacterium]